MAEEKRLEQLRHLIKLATQPTHKQALRQKTAANALDNAIKRDRLNEMLHGRSFMDLRRATGISPSAIGRIMRGDREPRVTTAVRMAKALGVEFSEFYKYIQAVLRNPIKA